MVSTVESLHETTRTDPEAVDVIAHIERALEDQREENSRGFDREAALADLRVLALEAAVARNQAELTPAELWQAGETPKDRARLRSLVDRAFPPVGAA